jgi:hypothetical protein
MNTKTKYEENESAEEYSLNDGEGYTQTGALDQNEMDFEDWLEGDWISFKDGETKKLLFKTKGERDTKPSRFGVSNRVIWNVVNVDRNSQVVKKLSLSRTHAKKICSLLTEGYTTLEITRTGSGQSDTRYIVKGIQK